MVDLILRGITAVRTDPLLAVWFEPKNMAIPIALSQNSELLHAMTTGLAGSSTATRGRPPTTELRGAWLLRCIVSLLAMPGESEASRTGDARSVRRPVALPSSDQQESRS